MSLSQRLEEETAVEESSTSESKAAHREMSRRQRRRSVRHGGQMKAVRRRARGYLSR